MNLLFGNNKPKTIFLILLSGALLAGVVAFLIKPNSIKDYFLILLSFDIGSGLVSNATKSTQREWLKIRSIYKYLFIIFHLLAYPLLIIFATSDIEILISLIVLLYIKTAFFVYGQKGTLNSFFKKM